MPQTRPNGAIVPIGSDPYAHTQDQARFADSLNVVIKIGSTAARDALTPTVGMMVVRTDLGGLVQTYVDGAWRSNHAGPYRWWHALSSFSLTAEVSASRAITFPSGLFSLAPGVQATKQSGSGPKLIPYVADVTAAGCTLGVYSGDGTTVTTTVTVALWVMQATPTSAFGNL